jgi:hypothetical protein
MVNEEWRYFSEIEFIIGRPGAIETIGGFSRLPDRRGAAGQASLLG